MELIALLLSLVALALAGAAFARTGGLADVRRQMESLSAKTDGARDMAARAIDRFEDIVRGSAKPPQEGGGPGSPGGDS